MSALPSIAEPPVPQRDWTVPAETLRVADLDQFARFLRGSYIYPFLLSVVAFTTPYQTDNPGCFLTFAAVIMVALALRFVLWLWSEHIYDANPAAFRRLLVASLSLSSTAAGLFYFSTLLFYGFEGWAFTTTFMWFTALAAGSTISLTPNFRLLQLQLLLLLGPVVVWEC